MMDRSLVWTGDLNQTVLGSPEARQVGLYDATLRDGEQTVGVVLDPEQKLEIARGLDRLGVDRIEAGFPRVSREDWEAVRRINQAGLHAEVWGFSRALTADVDALLELQVRATVIEAPLSEIKLAAYGVSRDTILTRIREAVTHAVSHGVKVAFFGVDGTRAEPDFLDAANRTAIEAGAAEVVVVDTIGIATPEAVAHLVARIRERLGPQIPLHFHGHNDFGLATAAAVAAVRAGASYIHGTVNGMGERAGNANLPEVALALEALYGFSTKLRYDRVREVSALVRRLSGCELEPWKPLVGENLFKRESGAVAAQFHAPEAIEPFSSTLVAAERRIVLGKKSGIDSIRIRAEQLGLSLSEERQRQLLDLVKALATQKRGLVDDAEFQKLVEGTKVAP